MMIERIGDAAMLEQLAEEASELAQAALKKARFIRKENPTPKTAEQVDADLREETSDVIQCLRELKIYPNEEQIKAKEQRFAQRWSEREG